MIGGRINQGRAGSRELGCSQIILLAAPHSLAGLRRRLIGGMKLLFLGDVMGRAGRAAMAERLPALRADWGLDFVVVNGENASRARG